MISLPTPILSMTAGKIARRNDIGFSNTTVYEYEDMVLKISLPDKAAENAARMMRWLDGRLPVPRLLCDITENGRRFQLISRINGEMSCAPCHMRRPSDTVDALAEGIRLLWDTDITDCPCHHDLDHALSDARRNIETGIYDAADATPGTFGKGGFSSPTALLDWLERNRPEEELVLAHGDYCMPNILLKETPQGTVLGGFIDLDTMGIADRWQDIALCARSLRLNFAGAYGGSAYPGLDLNRLFAALGVPRDNERLRYYTLLDELSC